ncbi:helix-turn-helix domain-containing protein [Paenibacillus chitinolyticus]|uniref:helix-turn-helix domain-containing protein n=1 Tax=Paenibacillus chitinolyticus TaxID=79263 RepID=UPI001C4527D5|nr:helix-turn-helix transcriptional regulator [Paenibacillus chitinolyticus]
MAIRIERSRLPLLLAQVGMTQAQLARRLKLTDLFIHKVIKGERKLSLVKTKEAAIIFDCNMEDLYEWTDETGTRW